MLKLHNLGVILAVLITVYFNYKDNLIEVLQNVIGNSDKKTTSVTEQELYNIISSKGDRLYTKKNLAQYDGESESLGLYLAILGRVYDVSDGKKYYGPGGGYSFFSGKDGTKAFLTGEFNEKGLIDETTGLTNGQFLELENWIKFYDKTYVYKGKLIGNFYDESGEPTTALRDTVEALKIAHAEKMEKENEKKRFPPCNSQSKKGEYRRLFCSQKSGGIERSWVGYPRRYFSAASDKPRCVCVNEEDLNHPNVRQYEDCDPLATSCLLPPL